MDLKLDLFLILILFAVAGYYIATARQEIGEIDSKILAINEKINITEQTLSTHEQGIAKLEKSMEEFNLSCKYVRHGLTDVGDNICKNNGPGFCLFSVGNSQEYFFDSKDGTCSGGSFPKSSKDFSYRTFDCTKSIDSQTNGYYSDNEGKCIQGGMLNTDHWDGMLNTGSFCCN